MEMGVSHKTRHLALNKGLCFSLIVGNFNSELPSILAFGASSFEIGAVLAQWMPYRCEKPTGYASHKFKQS